jgi:hypothetical protein
MMLQSKLNTAIYDAEIYDTAIYDAAIYYDAVILNRSKAMVKNPCS